MVLCKQASELREAAPGVTDWRKFNMVEEKWHIGVARNIGNGLRGFESPCRELLPSSPTYPNQRRRSNIPLPFRGRVRIVARDEQKSIFRSAKSLHRSRNFDMQGCRSRWIAHSWVEVDAQHRKSQIQFTLHLSHALHALMLLLPQTRV